MTEERRPPLEQEQAKYIHGTDRTEQERLAVLNELTNAPFLRFLDLKETDAVLEVGSGLGILTAEVAKRVPRGEAFGVEYSQEQLARAAGTLPNLHFLHGDAHHLPFEDSRFDIVYCRYVLEHVADPPQVLREMHRVLKPGGKMFAQENDVRMFTLDPDCPAFEVVWERFIALQAQLGGDALIGKRLFGLFRRAGFREIELSFQPEIHPANKPTFRTWMENCIDIVEGASEALRAHHLATQGQIDAAIEELRRLMERDDASALFHWNQARGIK